MINNLFDCVFVINMDKDVDRLKKMDEDMNKYGIEYVRFSGIEVSDEQYDRWKSFYHINENKKIKYETFDWEAYLSKYPDLTQSGITNKNEAWEHWMTHGRRENRRR